MRTGAYVAVGAVGLDEILEQVRAVRAAGLGSAYFAQLMSWDPLTLVAAAVGGAAAFDSYRRLLDLQGLTGVEQTAALGDESVVAATFARYAEAGVTELVVGALGDEREQARTWELLATVRHA